MTALERLKNMETVGTSAASTGAKTSKATTASTGRSALDRLKSVETVDAATTATDQQKTDNGFDLAKFMAGTLGKGANAIAKTGSSALAFFEKSLLEPLFPGITQSTPIQDLNKNIDQDTAYLDSKYSANTAKGGKAAQVAEDVGVGVIQAIPQALLAVGTAGSSLAAQGLSKAAASSPTIVSTLKSGVSQAAKNPNYWTAFLSTVGNDYESAKADGADDVHAGLYAVSDSLLGAAVEIGGGIQKLPTELQGSRFTVRNWINTMLDEGKEEVVQGVLSRGLENVVYNKGNAIASTTDENAIFNPKTSTKEFGLGAAVGGILGGTQGLVSNVAQNRAQKGRDAQTAEQEGNVTPTAQNAAGTTQNAAPEVRAASKGETVQVVENLRNNIPDLKNSPPVSTVSTGAVSAVEGQTMAEKARRLFDTIKGVVTRPGFGDIDINGRSVKDDLSHGVGAAKAAVIPAIPEVIKLGKQIDFQQNWKGRAYDGYVFAAPITLDSKTAYVAAVVKRTSKNRFYLHEVVDANGNVIKIDTEESANPTSLAANGDAGTQSSMSGTLTQSEGRLAGPTPVPSSEVSGHSEGTRPLNVDSTIAQGAENVKIDPPFQLLSGGSMEGVEVQREALPVRENDGIGAADAGFDPYSKLQNQTDRFHPEGANAARPVDVPTTNFEGRNIPKSTSTIMGAQALDGADVQFLERQIADGELAFDTIHDADAVAAASSTIERKGFDGALEEYRQAVSSNVASKNNTALGQQLLLRSMREGNVKNTAELLSLYTRNSTTVAQAMQAQSIFRKLSPEGQLLAVQRSLDDLNAKYGTDVQLTEQETADFLNAADSEARQEVQERIFERAAQSIPGTFRAKFDTLRYLSMLGNFRTHIRNILGNTMFQVPVMAKNRAGAVLEYAANRASGGKVERTKSLTGANPFGNLAKEARADWANAKDFLTQSSKYSEGQASLSAIEQEADAFSNENVVGRTINRLSDTNSALLAAEDTAAKKFIYAQSLAGYLKANGVKSIQDADSRLLYRARNYAAQEALRNTFNDRNMASDAVAKLGRLSRSDNLLERGLGYVVEGQLPFKRTPTNIAVRAVEYSPVGTVLGAVEAVRGAKAGDMTQAAKGLDRVAAGVSGTALLAAGFLAAGAGYVTGGEDEDDKQRDFDDLTGHQTCALELKNGVSATLDWLAPEAIPFFMGVELYNAGIDDGLTLDEVTSILKNMSAPMLEMSMLQGLNDTFDSAAYARNRGGSVLAAVVASSLTNYLTQVFPTISGQLERVGETERMSTYTDKNSSIPAGWQYTIGKVSQKIPGWDYNQIPYIDAWGRTEATGDALERSINNLFNPAYVSQVDVDEVEQELQRVKDATGDSGVFPARADKSFTVNGETKNLTAEEYTKYAKTVGQTRKQVVDALISQSGYQRLSDEEKAEAVKYAYQYATAKGKMAVSDYVPTSGFAKEAMKSVLPTDTYILYKLNKDRDGNGSTTSVESAQTLQELSGISDRERGQEWETRNSSTSAEKNPFTGALPQAGISVDTSIRILDKYREISDAKGAKPKDKGKQFRAYVEGLGLTPAQKQAVKETYSLYGSYYVDW